MDKENKQQDKQSQRKKTASFIKKVASFSGHPNIENEKLCRHKNCSSCDGCG